MTRFIAAPPYQRNDHDRPSGGGLLRADLRAISELTRPTRGKQWNNGSHGRSLTI